METRKRTPHWRIDLTTFREEKKRKKKYVGYVLEFSVSSFLCFFWGFPFFDESVLLTTVYVSPPFFFSYYSPGSLKAFEVKCIIQRGSLFIKANHNDNNIIDEIFSLPCFAWC
jgi:hypothetical protein